MKKLLVLSFSSRTNRINHFKLVINPLNPKSDQHLISPYDNIAESFIVILRKEEVIANLRSLEQYQYLGNCPPTPPLTQQESIDNKLGLMLG